MYLIDDAPEIIGYYFICISLHIVNWMHYFIKKLTINLVHMKDNL